MTLTGKELAERLRRLNLIEDGSTILGFTPPQAYAYLELYKSRASTLTELADSIQMLGAPPVYDHIPSDASWLSPHTGRLLHQFLQESASLKEWHKANLLAAGRTVVQSAGVGLALLGQPLRFAMVGSTMSPGIFDIMAIMGRDECLQRIRTFEELLRSTQ